LFVFREATEGLYSGIEFAISEDSAIAIRKITRHGDGLVVVGPLKQASLSSMIFAVESGM